MKKILTICICLLLYGCSNINDYSKKELICKTIETTKSNVTEMTTTFTLNKEGTVIKSCNDTQIVYNSKYEAQIGYDAIKNIYENSKLIDNTLNFTTCSTHIDEKYKNINELMKYMKTQQIECKLKDTNE